MVTPYLPEFGKEIKLQNSGEWIATDGRSIDALLRGIDSQSRKITLADLHGVPDMLAIATIFHQAFDLKGLLVMSGENQHEGTHAGNNVSMLHDSAVSTWRALIALLAVRSIYPFDAEIVTITKEEINDVAWLKALALSAWERLQLFADGEEQKCIHHLDIDTFANSLTDCLALLSIANQPVALLLPSTLVAPVRDIDKLISPDRNLPPWLTYNESLNGFTKFPRDPLLTEKLSPSDVSAIWQYLSEIERIVSSTNIALLKQIEKYKEDLGKSCAGKIDLCYSVTKRHVKHQLKFLGLELAFKQGVNSSSTWLKTDSPFKSDPVGDHSLSSTKEGCTKEGSIKESYIKEGNTEEPSVIFYDPDMVENEYQNINIWRGISASRFNIKRERPAISASNYYLATPDDLFENTLTQLKKEGAQEYESWTDNPQDFSNYLLPLKPIVFLIYRPEQLCNDRKNNILSIEQMQDGVKVTLRIKLYQAGAQGELSGYDYLVSRIYREDCGKYSIKKQSMADPTAIWPNFYCDDWQHYFIYSKPIVNGLKIDWVAASQQLPGLKSLANGNETTLTDLAHRLESNFYPVNPPRYQQDELTGIQIGRSQVPFDMICCSDMHGKNRGLLLVNYAARFKKLSPIDTMDNVTIGLDFGTSRTCVYLKRDSEKYAEQVVFGDLVAPIFDDMGAQNIFSNYEDGDNKRPDYQKLYETQFVPHERIAPPFLSMFRDRSTPENNISLYSTANTEENHLQENFIYEIPFLVGNVIYAVDPSTALTELQTNYQEYVPNLKWDSHKKATLAVKRYIRQVALQTAAHVRILGMDPCRARWGVACPGAMEKRKRDKFFEDCQNALVGILDFKDRGGFNPEPYLESQAAYVYARKSLRAMRTVVYLDIGGGTTDVAIVHRNAQSEIALLWDDSILIAAQMILVRHWLRDIDRCNRLLDRLFESKKTGLYIPNNLQGPEKLRYAVLALEMIINTNNHADTLKDNLDMVQDESLFVETQERIRLSVWCFLDLVISSLKSNANVSGKLNDIKNSRTMSIVIGGGGSQMVRDFYPNGFNANGIFKDDKLTKYLEEQFGGIGLNQVKIEVKLSENPKSEVAYGVAMLIDNDEISHDASWQSARINKPCSFDLKKITGQFDREIKEFLRFIKRYDREYGTRFFDCIEREEFKREVFRYYDSEEKEDLRKSPRISAMTQMLEMWDHFNMADYMANVESI